MKKTICSGRQRGVSLVEVLVVVAIMSLLAAAVGIAAYSHFEKVKQEHAATTAKALRQAVQAFWITGEGASCPTVKELARAGTIDEDSSPDDPWGSPWSITCNGTSVVVRSEGPDRSPNTEDDIRAPKSSTSEP